MNLKTMKEYRIWRGMKARCYAPCNKNMGYYQKDNITVCDRWKHSFENFLHDMGHIPADNYSIERIDNLKGYSPDNCCWIPFSKQSRNRRSTIHITYKGKTRTLKEWANVLSINYYTLTKRMKRGIPFEKAIQNNPLRFVEINGKKQYISDWCKELNISVVAVYSRMSKHKIEAKEAILYYMNKGEIKQ